MPITVACQCGAKFAAKDELAGKAVKCPKCSQPLKIPGGAAASPSAPASKAAPKATPAKTATQPKAPTKPANPSPPTPAPASASAVGSILDEIGLVGSKTGVKCPKCQGDMQPGAVICIACGFNTQTGKQLTTYSDAAATAKREAIYEERRKRADARFKASGGAGGSSSSSYSSSYGDSDRKRRDGLPIATEGASAGSAFRTAWAIIFDPAASFSVLPTRGGVGDAVTYIITSIATVYGVYTLLILGLFLFQVLMVLMSEQGQQLVSQDPGRVASGIGMILAGTAIYYAVLVLLGAIGALIQGALWTLGSYPIVKYAGHSPLGFGSTYQCVLYVFGTVIFISAIPCVGPFIGVVILFVYMALAFTYHHQINGGISALAVFVGFITCLISIVMIYLMAFAAIYALLAPIIERARGPQF
jgi:hypothetical protein